MIEKRVFVAVDGKEFDNRFDCVDHEDGLTKMIDPDDFDKFYHTHVVNFPFGHGDGNLDIIRLDNFTDFLVMKKYYDENYEYRYGFDEAPEVYPAYGQLFEWCDDVFFDIIDIDFALKCVGESCDILKASMLRKE